MKKLFLNVIILIALQASLSAQKAPYKVVFDVTSKDTLVHQMVMRWVREITKFDPTAQIEVVYYAKSLDMITKDRSVVADEVVKYAAGKQVSFKVCEAAMKNNSIEPNQLLPGVSMVPDGIYEIISKQYEGWGYIKASR